MEFPELKNGGFTKCLLVCSDRRQINHSISTKLATNVIIINFSIIEKQSGIQHTMAWVRPHAEPKLGIDRFSFYWNIYNHHL